MPEYRISPDQGVCPEGHPCALMPYDGTPYSATLRQCDDGTHHLTGPYYGPALVDVYAGPVGVEAYHEAVSALRALEADHEAQEHTDHPGGDCPGWEVCSSVGAFALRAIREVLR